MLIPLVSSITIAIISSIGLFSFFSNSKEKSSLPVDNLITVVFAAVFGILISFATKLVYGAKEVKNELPTSKKGKKNKSKSKLSNSKVLALKGRGVPINNEVEALEPSTICEEEKELKENQRDEANILNRKDSSLSEKHIDQEVSVTDEEWIDVIKKGKKKGESTISAFANINKNIVKKNKEKIKEEGGGGSSNLKTSKNAKACTNSTSRSTERRKISSVEIEKNDVIYTVSRNAVEEKIDLNNQHIKENTKSKISTTSYISYAQKVAGVLPASSAENKNASAVGNKESAISGVVSKNKAEEEVSLDSQHVKEGAKPKINPTSYVSYAQKVSGKLPASSTENKNASAVGNKGSAISSVVSKNKAEEEISLDSQHIKEGAKPKINPTSYISYAQKVSGVLPASSVENKDASAVENKESTISSIVSKNKAEEEVDLDSQYIKEGAKPKTNAISYVSYAQKVSGKLPASSVENKDASAVGNKESTISSVVSKNKPEEEVDLDSQYIKEGAKPKTNATSCVSYAQKVSKGVVSSSVDSNLGFGNNEYNPLVESESTGSGLHFEYLKGIHRISSDLQYRKQTIVFCSKLRKLRKLHFDYCVQLVNQAFKIVDDQLVISNDFKEFLSKCTLDKGLLIFVLKVFLLVNLSTLCGGKDIIHNLRYSAKHFRDQSLLNRVMVDVVKVIQDEDCLIKVVRVFDYHSSNLSEVLDYEPYSGKFFEKIFDLCTNLALIEGCEKYDELIDFAVFSCMMYCGTMVGTICKTLIYDRKISVVKDLVHDNLKAAHFCKKCRNLKNAMVHIYHPNGLKKETVPRNIGGIINVPLNFLQMCSKEIDDTVKNAFRKGEMSFGIFVKDIILPIKGVMLIPNTRRFYRETIEIYNSEIKTAKSLLTLPTRQNEAFISKLNSSKSL